MVRPHLKARCIDCVWREQINKDGGRTSLSWFCPKGDLYLIASLGSLYARRKCIAFVSMQGKTSTQRNHQELRESFQKTYCEVLEAAKAGEQRCLEGRRWDGKTLLIIVDAALDSIGLNYFKIVVPRVKQFHEEFLKDHKIESLEELSNLPLVDARLAKIMNNNRVWKVATTLCRVLCQIKYMNNLKRDFDALRYWAQKANYQTWQNDPVGNIPGLGLITFQYLRMQAGIDTGVPDKIIKKALEHNLGIKAIDNIQLIKEMEVLSKKLGYSQIMICWAIWLKEANVKTSVWEKVK